MSQSPQRKIEYRREYYAKHRERLLRKQEKWRERNFIKTTLERDFSEFLESKRAKKIRRLHGNDDFALSELLCAFMETRKSGATEEKKIGRRAQLEYRREWLKICRSRPEGTEPPFTYETILGALEEMAAQVSTREQV